MSEAVRVPSLTMVTSTVSEESLARDTQTDRQTRSPFYLKIGKVAAMRNQFCKSVKSDHGLIS